MLKTRVIPTLLIRDVSLVKGPAFDSWRSVGSPMQSVKVFNRREVDELILLDIEATPKGREPEFSAMAALAQECFVPLTIGGGVSSIEAIRRLLQIGADKVAINTVAYSNPALVGEAAVRFGSQCVVAAIDFRRHADGRVECFSHCGTTATGCEPVGWARRLESLGAGEILLTSIDRDGMMTGYDLDVVRSVTQSVSIPVIASGGAGSYEDMRAAVQDAGASAVSAASLYLFTEATPLKAKEHLARAGVAVRSIHR
jgi:cyclase